MAREFARTFLRDAEDLLARLRRGSEDEDGDDGLEIARALHSLKSGAAFLGWTDLEDDAHRLEDRLADSDDEPFDRFAAAETLDVHIRAREAELRAELRPERKVGRFVRFGELERRVLEESRVRDESFYRLTCRVDPTEPLPYPRAYLVAAKIETGMTLVKSDPPMDDPDEDFSRPTFWFTTDQAESAIHRLADVDLIEVVELKQLDYDDVLGASEISLGAESAAGDAEDATLNIDRIRYNDALQLAEELAWRLEGQPGTPEAELASQMQRSLETLAFRPLEPLLNDIAGAASRLAERRGLKAEFRWSTASAGLDSGTLEVLVEILKQLVRNALKHGIEAPELRAAAGKNEVGTMELQVERSGATYRFRFADDGRGIDEEAVSERARGMGLDTHGRESTLLDLLCAPGFSTTDETDSDGGRGIGLEMVRSMVRSEFESDLELENRPGRGVALSWTLHEKYMRRPYLVFRADGRSWAIPAGAVRRREVMDPARVKASGQTYAMGGGQIPIVGPQELRPPGSTMPYVLEIAHRERRAALLVDDLLSEEPWGPDDLVRADPESPWCRSLKDARGGIPILSPALVYAADRPTTVS